ncbi:hypothetical protein MYU51_001697 [Penicillium brevicompactum]|uniref:uncharacterized protein n=1 Tax=Penicillium brevicompactum TaxID=5074 RepID=UPI00253F7DC2|nr:uncharacterized protein N7506_009880 [Penicillium brevicompactum]KAJ5326778.1 hypothetical protein N7506_009880 [Penicillium brevicompactum]
MLRKLNVATDDIPRTKFRLHIAIGSLVALTFILIIARVADSGTPRTRTNTWGIAVCVKSAVFMAYQICTGHVDRLKKWHSTKFNVVLNVIDTVFWFALFIISILGAAVSRSTSSRVLGVIVILLTIVLCPIVAFFTFICMRERRYFKQHGTLPGEAAKYPGGV